MGLRMRESIRFHFFAELLSHTRSVAQAYARGLRMRHPHGIRGLGKAFNSTFFRFQVFYVSIFGSIIVQLLKDSNMIYNFLQYHVVVGHRRNTMRSIVLSVRQ